MASTFFAGNAELRTAKFASSVGSDASCGSVTTLVRLSSYCVTATHTATSGTFAVLASTPQETPRSPTNVAGLRAGPQ
jgi:hypothetical protein